MKIREELAAFTTALRDSYESSRTTIKARLSANALIRNREYAFAIYPEELLRNFLMPLSELSLSELSAVSKKAQD